MIIISPQAKDRLKALLAENPGQTPRIHFQEAGVGMPDLKLGLTTRKEKTMIEEETEGISFVIDEDVSYFTRNLAIDIDPQKNGAFRVIARGDDTCDGDCNRCSGCPEP